MKIKCIKINCPVCSKSGSCQLFHNKLGQVRYARVRHYSHIDKDSKKPQFTYCKLTYYEALKTLLSKQGIQLNTSKADNGQSGQTQKVKSHDPVVIGSSSDLKNSKCLGSLAWWGTALVRRRSRDQSPPEALLFC